MTNVISYVYGLITECIHCILFIFHAWVKNVTNNLNLMLGRERSTKLTDKVIINLFSAIYTISAVSFKTWFITRFQTKVWTHFQTKVNLKIGLKLDYRSRFSFDCKAECKSRFHANDSHHGGGFIQNFC